MSAEVEGTPSRGRALIFAILLNGALKMAHTQGKVIAIIYISIKKDI
jgi:hypothetical protein